MTAPLAALPPLLFHGTSEAFDLPLRPGGYDDVLWTADASTVAQTYIPDAGLKILLGTPSHWELQQGVRPGKHNPWYLIVQQMGWAALETEYDAHGQLKSWRLPKGYPTYAEALTFVREALGYPQAGSAAVWLKASIRDGYSALSTPTIKRPGACASSRVTRTCASPT